MTMLDALPAAALPAGQHSLLRARLLIAQDQWVQARTVLEEASKADAPPAEVHYLLGTVYEHQQDWPRAAQEYRAFHDAAVK